MSDNMELQKEMRREAALSKGFKFLEQECQDGTFSCDISNSPDMRLNSHTAPRDTCSPILILQTILREKPDSETAKRVISYCKDNLENGHLGFFEDGSYPEDADTASWYLSTLYELGEIDEEMVNKSLDDILNNTKDGVIQVYIGERKNRIDHVTATNALYLAYLMGREGEVASTEDYVFNKLKSGEYLSGSRYYQSPDSFLYYLSRLVVKFPTFREKFGNLLEQELKKRIGITKTPLDLAMRVTVARNLGLNDNIEKDELLSLQEESGSWPNDAVYHYGTKDIYFGSRALTTAYALEAIK